MATDLRLGWEERHYCAEALRIRGRLLSLKGDPAGAESAYIASLDWARTQQAKSWELRTATSYARLMRDQSRAREAYELLAPVYGWFTEGFATNDLKEAKTLLDELAQCGSIAWLDGYIHSTGDTILSSGTAARCFAATRVTLRRKGQLRVTCRHPET